MLRTDLPVALSASQAIVRTHETGQVNSYELLPFTLPADQNPALVYLASLSAGSRRTMTQALDTLADLATGGAYDHVRMPWHMLRYQHTQALRATLAERYNARTANKMLSALRRVLKEAWRLGLMTAEESARAADVRNIEVSTPSQAETGRHLTMGELMALMGACADGSNAGARDAALIAVGYACGLRRSELAGLQVSDFERDQDCLTIRGKRNKTRIVPINDGALDALSDWLHVRGDESGPLFVQIRRGDHMKDEGISAQAVYNILESRREMAGVKPFTPHDLRRTFAGELLSAGADIATVQQLMGHASVTTTAGYDRRGAEAKRKAVAKLHVPYQKRF